MPDKDFEQQVREGLQDWEMTPSAAIRQAVLDKVRERRRRRLVLWAPLAVLLLGLCVGGGWYLRRPAPARGAVPANGPAASSTAVSTGPAASPVAAPGLSGAAPLAAPAVPATSAKTSPAPVTEASGPSALVTSVAASSTEHRTLDASAPAVPISTADASLAQATPVNLPRNGWIAAVTASEFRLPVAQAENPVKAKGKPESRWALHFYAGAGAAGQGGLLQFHTPERSIDAPSAPFNNAGPTGGNTSYRDTLVAGRAGPGLELGLGVALRLSKRFQVGAGLGYDRMETTLSGLWQGVQSAVSTPAYYGTGGAALAQVGTSSGLSSARQVSYTNVFQHVRVPLDLSWRMAPASRWNPALFIGASPAYLFGGSALMYNTEGIGYEKNPALYRHWSLDGEAGVTVDVVRVKGFVLQAGPVLTYDLFNVQQDAPVKDHLNYAGLRIGVVIPAGHKNIQP